MSERDKDIAPTHGQYFVTDKLRGEDDWQRIKQIALDNGFSIPGNADDVWRYSYKIQFLSTLWGTNKRLRFTQSETHHYAPERFREEIELPRPEPAATCDVDMEQMMGLLLKLQAENDAMRGKLFDYVSAQDEHLDGLFALLKVKQ